MFTMAEAAEIGAYLTNAMNDKFGSKRQFCRAYIEYEGRDATEDEINKMANRISQITNGKKGIQTFDLPIFCNLLDMSCEQILSAGKCFSPQLNRVTNYSVAFSNDKRHWEEYVSREDNLILNQDEYGNTAIDYALEFKNYGFIKFLMDRGYIWFDGRKDNNYVMTFGAGTSIKRRDPYRIDDFLQYKLSTEDQLRMDIIALAVENQDFSVLDSLRAREIPALYYGAHYLSCTMPDIEEHKNSNMIAQIANASDEIVEYFTDSFPVRDYVKYKDGSKREHTFLFPYISELLDLLIENKHSFTEFAVRKCIKHNDDTYKTVKRLIDEAIKGQISRNSFGDKERDKQLRPGLVKDVLSFLKYSENGNIVSFRDFYDPKGIITNIVHVSKSSSDVRIKHLIQELNESFDRIVKIMDEYADEMEEA